LVPALDGSDDAVRVGGPDEGFGVVVGFADEAVDGGLEIGDGAEDTALEAASGELGEEAFDGVQPQVGVKWKVQRG
jgi:hypothetical protein